jgi:integrase
LNLRINDVDLQKCTLTIKKSKFDKSRMVVMDGSLALIVSQFLDEHCKLYMEDDYLFKHRDGAKRSNKAAYECFRELLWKCGIPFRGRGYGPRLHDVRHTFCCHSLKKMSDAGIDMYCALPVLSAYLGHSGISSTERYLRLTEEFYPDVRGRVQMSVSKV